MATGSKQKLRFVPVKRAIAFDPAVTDWRPEQLPRHGQAEKLIVQRLHAGKSPYTIGQKKGGEIKFI
eukprot:1712492-Rhodomonas_salina.2